MRTNDGEQVLEILSSNLIGSDKEKYQINNS